MNELTNYNLMERFQNNLFLLLPLFQTCKNKNCVWTALVKPFYPVYQQASPAKATLSKPTDAKISHP